MKKLSIPVVPGRRIYFASDFHLGAPDRMQSLERERKIIRWLDQVKKDAAAIFLVGDIFDFWFEYPHVIPKGFIRFQGKLAEIRDMGIPLYFFHGNHDMWMFDYFQKELDIPIYRDSLILETGSHRLFIAHGDGLGPGDHTYKLLKKIFRSPLAQWAFKWLHPSLGMALANSWSAKSRIANDIKGHDYDESSEWLLDFCREMEIKDHHDYYIFGHRHLPLEIEVSPASQYINLGEWVLACTYAAYDGKTVNLLKFEG
ncbi:MAG: UDP-2,3-diacylglucosamine diphosphatase [Cyclobacteriaceae bacterium]|nr:UDP-2,3-diacylglucosamine diphosphatase [Cyclobacteriaceae bacterium]